MLKRLKQILLSILSVLVLCGTSTVYAEGVNPYYGGYYNCTWTAWQLVYDKLGIAMPNFGNAGNWYDRAASLGYWVDQSPSSNSVVVWSGHVGYVDEYDPATNMMFVEQGGMSNGSGGYWAGWMNVGRSLGGQSLYGFIHFYDAPVAYSESSVTWTEEAYAENEAVITDMPSADEQEAEARRVNEQREHTMEMIEDLRPMVNTYEIRADIPTEKIEEKPSPMMLGSSSESTEEKKQLGSQPAETTTVSKLHIGSPEGETDVEVKKPLRLG